MSKLVDSLIDVLGAHSPWVALTGAGVSSASGIPTYRDHNRRWLSSQPILHDEFVDDISKRQRYWSRSALGWPRVSAAEPNKTHTALATLEKTGLLTGVITQNVDRLHQQAGSQCVVDLHGRLDRVKCLVCDATKSREAVQKWIEDHNELPERSSLNSLPDGDADLPDNCVNDFQTPRCDYCNGVVMPEVIFFGGSVPRSRVEACYQLIDAAAGMMVLGSSLSVYSGLRLCRYAVSQGKPLIILNQGHTRADDLCAHKFADAPFTLLVECADHFLNISREAAHG